MPTPPASPPSTAKRLLALQAFAAPREVSARMLWLETLVIPLIGICLAWWLRPEDPTLIHTSFPWLWLAPVLVALRYGVLPGLLAIAPLLANWFLAAHLLGGVGAFPQGHFFGGILLTLLCGEFADVWRERNARIEETNLYMAERVSRLTRRHLLLNLSHDRLEQEMLTRPGSIRDALVSLRDSVFNAGGNESLPAVAELLEILAQYTNIQAAAFHPVDPAHPQHIAPAVRTIGKPAPLASDDELLQTALEHGELAHVAEFSALHPHASNQLVVAPVITSDQQVLAVLAVSELPFFSLNVENLQLMSVILGYYADSVHSAPALAEIRRHLPTIPPMYAEELARVLALQQRFGIDSHIVVMGFRGTQGEQISEQIVDQFLHVKRGLDLCWRTEVEGVPTLALLMPFATQADKEGFLLRFENWLQSRFGGDCERLDISLYAIDFASHDPVAELQRQMGG